MKREELLRKIENWGGYRDFADVLSETDGSLRSWPLRLLGVEGAGAAYAAYAAVSCGVPGKKLVYLAPNDYAARRAYEDFDFLSGHRCVYLEHSEYMFYDALARSAEIDYRRMEALKKVLDGDFDVLVLPAESFMQFMPSPARLGKSALKFSAGDTIEPLALADALAAIGYTRVGQLDGKRQFAVRGDILDVFPTSSENPYRIEFYGDEIDSVRIFDLLSQRTIETAPCVEILADSEQSAGDKGEMLCEKVERALAEKLSTIENPAMKRQIEEKINADIALLRSGMDFPGRDRYLPFVIGREYHILDYVPDAVVFVQEWQSVVIAAETVIDEHGKTCEVIDETVGVLAPLWNFYMTPAEMENILREQNVVMTERYYGPEQADFDVMPCVAGKKPDTFIFKMKPIGDAGGNINIVDELLERWEKEALSVCILAGSKAKTERIHDLMRDRAPSLSYDVMEGALTRGFESRSLGYVFMSDVGLAGKSTRTKTKKAKRERDIDTFADIAPGDLVVHDLHGIGRFDGFKSIALEGVMKDYLVIRYAEDGVLYLPSYQLDTIHKFIGSDNAQPKLNTLGGKEWQRAKQRVRDSLREYVEELAALYAKRSQIKGFAYSADNVWQTEFEDSFLFEPTEDQVKCTEEIKHDMERPVPMDRLLCGDVGFGKTEVALRAAFKAVCDGKQVAFLVPTTVLAQQHYQNIAKRFEEYPVTVDYICRFRTPKEKSQVLAKLAKGKIDILIGTHSILQKKAVFRDLGLIIIDEEQRFGVMQKENLKMKWPGTDILTLSATPIPRTLHMSLSGIRDISLLTEPPKSRSPVQTYVLELNPDVVKNAIYREMARNGQVFYLFNSVQRINEKRIWLQTLVPEARIGVAHGQMPERELENVMNSFVRGEFDVLLCTTIIESGLDLPNANTIVVEDGHRLGLAQLYQIRGRVGRSDRRAYAYITYPPNYRLNEEADKRLNAIKEFTEFGSGFKIALRDLEIRGAGSVLGEKQHGQLAAVGYDMYCKLLGEMVTAAQGGTVKEETVINVEFNVSSFIPEEYIADPDTRLDIYRKIARVRDDDDISDLTDELIDRFGGDIPENVINLMHVSKIRCLAADCGVASIIQHGAELEFLIGSMKEFERCYRINRTTLEQTYRNRLVLTPGGKRPSASLKLQNAGDAKKPKQIVSELEKFFTAMCDKTDEDEPV